MSRKLSEKWETTLRTLVYAGYNVKQKNKLKKSACNIYYFSLFFKNNAHLLNTEGQSEDSLKVVVC